MCARASIDKYIFIIIKVYNLIMKKRGIILFIILLTFNVNIVRDYPDLQPRTGQGMVYDSINKKVILFGGMRVHASSSIYFNDIWTYSVGENTWSLIQVPEAPPPRGAPAMAYSPDHQQVILFGGMNSLGRLDDTWAYDCSKGTWTLLETENRPQGRCDSAMVYDSLNEQFILYGGYGARSRLHDDTWIYDLNANTWTEVKTESNPGKIYGHSMVWDPVNDRVILYGGHLNSPISQLYVNNTWFYYPQNCSWAMQEMENTPHGRYWGAMSYDWDNMKLVYFNGGWGEGPHNETWILDLKEEQWTLLETEAKPCFRIQSRMVYIPNHGFFLFGGADSQFNHFNDTWTLSLSEETWTELHPTTVKNTPIPTTDIKGIPGFPLVSLIVGLVLGTLILTRYRGHFSHPFILVYKHLTHL